MNLNTYIDLLKEMVKENPEVGKMTVVYASDDEGNSFDEVRFAPMVGMLHDSSYGETVIGEEDAEYFETDYVPNVVVIN